MSHILMVKSKPLFTFVCTVHKHTNPGRLSITSIPFIYRMIELSTKTITQFDTMRPITHLPHFKMMSFNITTVSGTEANFNQFLQDFLSRSTSSVGIDYFSPFTPWLNPYIGSLNVHCNNRTQYQ